MPRSLGALPRGLLYGGERGWPECSVPGDYVGLGVDNIVGAKIVGAKIVTATGDLVEASGDVPWALRRAGGNLGIIADTKVQVYPMTKIQAGFMVYPWEETSKVLKGLQDLLDAGVSDKLCIQAGFSKGDWSLGMALTYIWPKAETTGTEGQEWLQKLKDLGTMIFDTIHETTYKDFQASVSDQISEPVYVSTRHVSIEKFTEKTLAQLTSVCEAMPDEASCTISVNILHGKATKPKASSSFGTRKPLIMFHINAVTDEDSTEKIGVE
ncbi:hypothetical protein BDP81DRAFT_390803 [Colletotrichum phormii]|uniref:Uncharacterized protein n=1 Tax=Colletotrichum phormii TaxID=359342 RepID=A0AAI9ZYB9_9PEZI|nr:uncharacterized protein BDP81DRAFT_390803 [Colletotrichum phormii]KAK1640035.1 hypothetical protein BDP81DRAFT_390803 [Colletotrichum phormii]